MERRAIKGRKVAPRLTGRERRRRNTGIPTEPMTVKLPTDVIDKLHTDARSSGRNNVSWELQVILEGHYGIRREVEAAAS